MLDRIMELGELRVITRNSPATFYYDDGRTPRGLEFELARGFAEWLGVELDIRADRPDALLPEVARGQVHVGTSLTVNEHRAALVAFGPTYQRVEHQVVYRRGRPGPRTLEDLVGGWIEVTGRSAHVEALEAARREEPRLTWVSNRRATAETLIRRVAHGEIDHTVVHSNELELLRQYYPEAQPAFSIGPTEHVAWALPPDAPRLQERVAAYFAEIRATGVLDDILERYYYAAREFDYVGSRAFVRHLKSRLPLYRAHFETAEARTGIDWRLLAALSYQESHWDPEAVSPTGVRGLMMLTRVTAEMMQVTDRADPRESILGGARYFGRIKEMVPARIPEPDRTWLTLAAYNLGFGHLEDGRIITEIHGGDPDRWEEVREHLPLLDDEEWFSRVEHGHARGGVAARYVENIRRYYSMLQWMTDTELLTDEPPAVPGAANPG